MELTLAFWNLVLHLTNKPEGKIDCRSNRTNVLKYNRQMISFVI